MWVKLVEYKLGIKKNVIIRIYRIKQIDRLPYN